MQSNLMRQKFSLTSEDANKASCFCGLVGTEIPMTKKLDPDLRRRTRTHLPALLCQNARRKLSRLNA